MYEMVTGRVPFEGDTNVAIALMHIQNDMIQPRQLYPDIYPSFEKIIMKASQKKPERRYLTAAALIADLNRVKDNPNIDIIVAPSTLTGVPTQQFTAEDMEKIKNGSANKYDAMDNTMVADSSEVRPDRSRIDALLNQEDEDFYDDTPSRRGGLKKIDDDDDGYSMDDDDDYDPDDESDVDPKLEKAVMIGGIAAAIIIAVIVFVVVGNMMGWFSFGSNKKTTEATTEELTEEEKVKMIDVVGLSEKAADKDLKEAGFTNYKFVEENSVDVKEGYVISQSIDYNTDITKDTEIIITVSAGAEEISVTDVKGMDEDDAYAALEAQGLKPSRSYKFDEEVEEGKAISTDPKAGSSAKAGDSIVIYISQGEEEKTVEVPDLAGLTETAAKGSLESNKLTVGNVTYEFNSDVESGKVIRQSVAAKTEVKEGTTVDIVISNGAETKTYSGKVTGSISTSDETLAASTVTVNVYINDDGGYHLAYTTTQSGGTINVDGSASGLSYNNGTVSYTVVDSNGADVSSSYSKSLTLSYTNE
jgi:serine/threonine-protein kinase